MKLKAVYDDENKEFAIYKEKKSGKYKYLFNLCKDLQTSLGIDKNKQCDIIYLELNPYKSILDDLSKNQNQVEVTYNNNFRYKEVKVKEHYHSGLGHCNFQVKKYYTKTNKSLLKVNGATIKHCDEDILNFLDKFNLQRFFIKFTLVGVLDEN